jgi:hypothetical protein
MGTTSQIKNESGSKSDNRGERQDFMESCIQKTTFLTIIKIHILKCSTASHLQNRLFRLPF